MHPFHCAFEQSSSYERAATDSSSGAKREGVPNTPRQSESRCLPSRPGSRAIRHKRARRSRPTDQPDRCSRRWLKVGEPQAPKGSRRHRRQDCPFRREAVPPGRLGAARLGRRQRATASGPRQPPAPTRSSPVMSTCSRSTQSSSRSRSSRPPARRSARLTRPRPPFVRIRADPEASPRRPGGDRVSPGDSEAGRRAQRVHSASTRSTTTANRPPQPYIRIVATCRDLVPVRERP